ncbi:MAG: hypothetical protein IJA17_07910 [Oscillospiraceae bacterium]|nr:hypothetical protein [Oscillospiraceae bacterium]
MICGSFSGLDLAVSDRFLKKPNGAKTFGKCQNAQKIPLKFGNNRKASLVKGRGTVEDGGGILFSVKLKTQGDNGWGVPLHSAEF